MLRGLQNVFEAVYRDASVNVMMICSSVPRVFCSGADLKERKAMSASKVKDFVNSLRSTFAFLEMGLRLVAPGGMQIRELHRWILKCHACYKVTTEIGRIFCPKCGNGGTLRKVAVTVGENGIVIAARRPSVSLRGTKMGGMQLQRTLYYEKINSHRNFFTRRTKRRIKMKMTFLLQITSFSTILIRKLRCSLL